MLHLNVIQADGTSNVVALANPVRDDIVWNADWTAFQVRPLRWHDNTSYIAYQADWLDCED